MGLKNIWIIICSHKIINEIFDKDITGNESYFVNVLIVLYMYSWPLPEEITAKEMHQMSIESPEDNSLFIDLSLITTYHVTTFFMQKVQAFRKISTDRGVLLGCYTTQKKVKDI